MRKLMAEANHFLFVDAGAFRYSADHDEEQLRALAA
jgi:hypothetical protein